MQSRHPVFTIGHSNRSLGTFIDMLRGAGIDTVVDVRTFPLSRTNPQFNTDTLSSELSAYQIGYDHWPDLGGRRTVQGNVAADVNSLWHNRSFHNYADYALTTPFQTAIARLIELAHHQRPALMCSEAVWWRCHRRIITDHLLARHIEVLHIMDVGKTTAAKITPGAIVPEDKVVEYPQSAGR